MGNIFLLILLAAVSAAQEIIMVRTMSGYGNRLKYQILFRVLVSAGNIAWLLFTAMRGPSVYIMLFGYLLLQLLDYYPYRFDRILVYTFCLMGFLMFTSFILVALGIRGLFYNESILYIEQLQSRIVILILGKISVCLFYAFWAKNFFYHQPDENGWRYDRRKARLFFVFLWCCVVYTYLDSFLYLYVKEGNYVPLLLVSGSLLIQVLMYLFMRNNTSIAQNQHLELLCSRIEAEKARHIIWEERMKELARKDGLTGALTRGYGLEKLDTLFKENRPLAAAYMDLDGLKKINDNKGHGAGDEYLKSFSVRMKEYLGNDALLIRLGGDEFLAVVPEMTREELAANMYKIREQMGNPENGGFPLKFSFGTASGVHGTDQLIKEADRAMYKDKSLRREEVTHAF